MYYIVYGVNIMNTCNNCESIFEGNFCNICGQRINYGKIIFKDLFNDFLSEVLTLESPLPKTLKELTLKPGDLSIEFIRGKRKTYYKPVKYFILTLAFYLLIKAILNFDPIGNQARAFGGQLPDMNNLDLRMQASYFMSRNINMMLFILVFVFALFSRLLFRKSGFNYTENLTFSFFISGHYLFMSSFMMILSLADPKLFYLAYLIVIVYFQWALINFHKENIFASLFKGLLAIVISYSLFSFIGYLISFFIVVISK